MKKNYKNFVGLLVVLLINSQLTAQITTPGNGFVPGAYVGWNTTNGANPLYFATNNTARMQLNGNLPATTTTIAAGTQNTSGFLGIGTNNPWSRVHIAAPGSSPFGGFRPWMTQGLTIQRADDQLWLGHVQWGSVPDQQNALINWGDDPAGGAGPDHFVFNYTASTYSGPYATPGAIPSASTRAGLEIMRLTDLGNVGIGPRFSNITPPQNLLHINSDNSKPAYLQITSELGTGQTLAKGFHIGITTTGVAEIKQKENKDLNFFTNNIFRGTIKNAGRFGINTANPGNRLEINSTTGDPYFPGTSSGLRFTNLKSTSVFNANSSRGVLSVDINGDVIFVPASSFTLAANNGVSLSSPNTVVLGGNFPVGTGATLLNDRVIPMNSKKIYFWGNANDGLVIGPNTSFSPPAKLQISANDPGAPNAIYAEAKTPGLQNIAIEAKAVSTANQWAYGVKSLAENGRILCGVYGAAGYNSFPTSTLGIGYSFGVKGSAEFASDKAYHWGIIGHASGSDNFNMGGEFIASSIDTNATTYGVFTSADGGYQALGLYAAAGKAKRQSYAVFGELSGSVNLALNPVSQNRAIYGKTTGTSLIGTVDNWAGYFDGDVYINGNGFYPGSVYITSDSMFKTQVDTITNALGIIDQLQPKTYFLDTANIYKINFAAEKQYGFIAQQVSRVLPELVAQVNKAAVLDTAGNILVPAVSHRVLNYNAFFALLMKGIQEQQGKIDSLTAVINGQDSINEGFQNQLDNLATQISNCCSTTQKKPLNPELNIVLKDKDIILLEQNVPNPFAQQTTIAYNIPATAGTAQLIFYNAAGSKIQTVEINTRGKGKMNVFAGNLSAGLYHYTLVVDGRIADSKKMVRQ